MKIESLIYIVLGIAFIIYRHYKQTQKAKQAGNVKRNVTVAEEGSYEEESHDSNDLSIENLFEEFRFEEKKNQRKFEKKEQVLDTIPPTKSKVLSEEGGRTTVSVTETPYVVPEPIIVKEELPKESVSEILRKYKEKQKENLSSTVFQNVDINIPVKDFHFDARQAFIYSEIFRRKYDY